MTQNTILICSKITLDVITEILYIYNVTNNTILPPNYSWYTFVLCYCSSTVADYILNDFDKSKISSDEFLFYGVSSGLILCSVFLNITS